MAGGLIVALLSLRIVTVAAAEDALSPDDYRWLSANLNVAREGLALEDLTDAQKAHVHALIGNRKASIDKKLGDVADYVYRVNGEDFAKHLEAIRTLIGRN
jgi:hypothetical protein